MMLPAVVLLLSICMLLESCAGRHAISDQNQKEFKSCDKYAYMCDDGECIPLPADWRHYCECQETQECEELQTICEDGSSCDNGQCIQYNCNCDVGFFFNKDTRKCEGADILNTSGCPYSSSTTNCDEFQLQCNAGQRIQILDAEYGKMEQSLFSSNTIKDISQESKSLNCKSSNILRPCKWSRFDKQYNLTQRYDLFRRCSWKLTCRPPSIGPGIAHSISHKCVPERPNISFCSGTSITRRFTNIVFDGRAFKKQFTTEQREQSPNIITQCECKLKSSSLVRMSAPDLRMVNANGSCIPSAKLSGISEEDITCSLDRLTLDAGDALTLTESIKLSFDIPPEFVWIVLEPATEGRQQLPAPEVTVNCSLPTNSKPPTSTPDHTTVTATSRTTTTDESETTTTTSTTTTGITDPATNNQTNLTTPFTDSTSTSPANNEGHEQSMKEQRDEEEGGFPLPAIIVPIVVILVVIVVVASIFIWQRQHRRQPDSKKPVEYESHVSPNRKQPTRAVQNKAYDDTDQKTTIQMKTANNYLADQNSHNRSGGHNYFVLEPQNLMEANPIVIETNKSAPTDQEASQNHDYFVLEPLKPQTDFSIPQETTATGTAGWSETKTKNNQNYEFAVEPPGNNQNYEFALEPQYTYSSIEPDDVIIQTLPENEYNVINMTGKVATSRDPNYGTLDTVDKKVKKSKAEANILTLDRTRIKIRR